MHNHCHMFQNVLLYNFTFLILFYKILIGYDRCTSKTPGTTEEKEIKVEIMTRRIIKLELKFYKL